MGGVENSLPGGFEPSVRDHSGRARILIAILESGRLTVSGGQFDWGGRLLKSNGGAQRLAQAEWKPADACKGKSQLDCEANEPSRDESRA